MLTTDQKGAIAEEAIAFAAIKFGVPVLRPMTDERYDLVLDLGDRFFRVQSKWAVCKGEVVFIRCRRCRRGPEGFIDRGYQRGEIEAIAAYCAELDETYLLPLEMSVGRATVQLRRSPTRNNQRAGIHWAREYEFGATLGRLLGP